MKVGTDGVLLGAWAELPEKGQLLDVGTGSGLIALMAAQRCPELNITGIEIDSEAVAQARENVEASPFANRVRILHSRLQDYASTIHATQPKQSVSDDFAAIVCNPPFFEESLLPPDPKRSNARHTDSLSFEDLVDCSATLLTDNGLLNVILPTTALAQFSSLCEHQGMRAVRLCYVRTTAAKQSKRTLATFLKCKAANAPQPEISELILQDGQQRSPAYTKLTTDFYLR